MLDLDRIGRFGESSPERLCEAIGFGTPLLVVAPKDSHLEDVIETAGRGKVFTGSNTDGMAQYLADLMHGRVPKAERESECHGSIRSSP